MSEDEGFAQDPETKAAVVEFQRHFHDDFEAFRKKIERLAVENNWSRAKQEQFSGLLISALTGYLLHGYAPGRLIGRTVYHARRIGAEVKAAFLVAKEERTPPALDKTTIQ